MTTMVFQTPTITKFSIIDTLAHTPRVHEQQMHTRSGSKHSPCLLRAWPTLELTDQLQVGAERRTTAEARDLPTTRLHLTDVDGGLPVPGVHKQIMPRVHLPRPEDFPSIVQ
jgi:hypothetical protein